MTKRDLFDSPDERQAKTYVEQEYSAGAFDPVVGKNSKADDITIAGIGSVRQYMHQSADTKNLNGEMFRVFPAIINSMQPNAFAARSGELHICGMHASLYVMIAEISYFVMAQRSMFQEIGDPEKEISPRFPKDSRPAYWLIEQTRGRKEDFDRVFGAQLLPRCPYRRNFADALSLLMMRFVWFHELYHCLNGHVGYLQNFVPNVRLNEVADPARLAIAGFVKSSLPLPVNRLLKALELDADRSALYGAYRTQSEDKENIIGIAELDTPMRCKLALFSAYLMTFLFDQINDVIGPDRPDTHPDSYIRLHDLIRSTASHLEPLDPNLHGHFRNVVYEMRQLAHALPELPYINRVLDDCQDQDFQARLDVFENDLNLLRGYFERFGYR